MWDRNVNLWEYGQVVDPTQIPIKSKVASSDMVLRGRVYAYRISDIDRFYNLTEKVISASFEA
jgi:hypothetical protein